MAKRKDELDRLREQSTAAKERIRSVGLRATPARIATLIALQSTKSPLTHAEVAEVIETLGADKATVLRNLTDLVAAGLARRTELGDRLWRYELANPEQPFETHPHFLCVDCGTVTCMEDVELTASSRRHSDRIGKVTEVLLKGHCTVCLPAETV